MPKSVKAGVAGTALIDYMRVAQKAIEGGTLDSDNDVYVLWRATQLDQEGWEAMGQIFESTHQQLDDVIEEAGKRLAASGTSTLRRLEPRAAGRYRVVETRWSNHQVEKRGLRTGRRWPPGSCP